MPSASTPGRPRASNRAHSGNYPSKVAASAGRRVPGALTSLLLTRTPYKWKKLIRAENVSSKSVSTGPPLEPRAKDEYLYCCHIVELHSRLALCFLRRPPDLTLLGLSQSYGRSRSRASFIRILNSPFSFVSACTGSAKRIPFLELVQPPLQLGLCGHTRIVF